jgi:recombination protein RecR
VIKASFTEIIFATNPTPEGEATASFIASKLKGINVKMSRLASGIPIGSSLEYIDRMTMHKALSGRRPF